MLICLGYIFKYMAVYIKPLLSENSLQPAGLWTSICWAFSPRTAPRQLRWVYIWHLWNALKSNVVSVCLSPPSSRCIWSPAVHVPPGFLAQPRGISSFWDRAWVSLGSTQEVLTAQLWADLSSSVGHLSIPSLQELISSPFPNPSLAWALQPPGKTAGWPAARACRTGTWLFYFYCCFPRLN